MAEPGYIEKLTVIKASVAIFILTFLTYQAAPLMFGQNGLLYQKRVLYYFLFTLGGWVMFYARTDVRIPTTGEWFPLKTLQFIPFVKSFITWSIIGIIGVGAIKTLMGLPLVGNPNGISIYALIDYSLIVAIHENLLWFVMVPPFLAIATWTTSQGRFVNSILPSFIAALGHAPNIYSILAATPGANTNGLWLPVIVSVVFVTGAFMFLFYITHQYGFAAGVAIHGWYDIMI